MGILFESGNDLRVNFAKLLSLFLGLRIQFFDKGKRGSAVMTIGLEISENDFQEKIVYICFNG